MRRQADELARGGRVEPQETRHWEPTRSVTVALRGKESGADYRTVPDPNLSAFELPDSFVERCRAMLPELPDARRARYEAEFGIKRADAEQLAGDPDTAAFFEQAAEGLTGKAAQTVANLVVNELAAYLKGAGASLTQSGIVPSQVASLAKLLAEDAISSNQAHEVFEAMAQSGEDPEAIVDARGMHQVSDTGALQPDRGRGARRLRRPGPAVSRWQPKGHRLFGGAVHEGQPRHRQPQALQRAAPPSLS